MNKIAAILSHPKIKENRFILPRYALVSLTSLVLGTLVLWLLTDKSHFFYLLSGIIGAMVSILTDFSLNELWTFSHRRWDGFSSPRLSKRLLKHIFSKSVGLGISFSILALGTQVFGLYYLISNFIGITASFVWNYSMSYIWVWARSRKRVRG